ncbi:chorismate synthase [Proteinivorax hydrogeniformans]|uniref:Chorismate synthase n=1 Tax=Proteinivorax hydrogeniformans TaxID=1826727 RepID=A0AAU8HPM2_9FIRM
MRYLTAGESHNKGLIAIIEGIPAGLDIDVNKINNVLRLRQGGYGRGNRMKIEKDKVNIYSGVRGGYTTGAPIGLVIENKDWYNYREIYNDDDKMKYCTPRPGHADLVGMYKYNLSDCRDVLERASARETAIRVAVGAISEQLLEKFNITIVSYVYSIGTISSAIKSNVPKDLVYNSPVYCPFDNHEEMVKEIDKAKEEKDSLGGKVYTEVRNLPMGLGSYSQWDKKLDCRLTSQVMSIPSVKGVEFGIGFKGSKLKGSQYHDEIFLDENKKIYRITNNAGGIEGGMSNGQHICFTTAIKPIPTVLKGLRTYNVETYKETVTDYQRSDTTVVPAASVVVSSVTAIEIARVFLEKFGGDSLNDVKNNFKNYVRRVERQKDYEN